MSIEKIVFKVTMMHDEEFFSDIYININILLGTQYFYKSLDKKNSLYSHESPLCKEILYA